MAARSTTTAAIWIVNGSQPCISDRCVGGSRQPDPPAAFSAILVIEVVTAPW